jgi:NADPH:quinone reductase
MKAILVVPGPEGAVYEYREVPAPAPKAGEVLVRVHATGTNRGELLARPLIRSSNPKLLPTIGGIEFAGEVVALAPGVASWKAGDRVMGRASGSYAPS